MSHVSLSHVWNQVPDGGRNGRVRWSFTARLRRTPVSCGHGRYQVPAVSRGAT
jgi:hypothetical protein